MELVMSNLLVAISILGTVSFINIYINKSERAFQMVFSFEREKNRKLQWRLAGRLMVFVSFVCYLMYAGIIFIIKRTMEIDYFEMAKVPIFGFLLPVLCMMYMFLWLTGTFSLNQVGEVVGHIFLMTSGPLILGVLCAVFRLKLDQYAGCIVLGMLFLVVIALRRNRKAWREGDM